MFVIRLVRYWWDNANWFDRIMWMISLAIFLYGWMLPPSDDQTGVFAFWVIYSLAIFILLPIKNGVTGLFQYAHDLKINGYLDPPESFYKEKLTRYYESISFNAPDTFDIELPTPYSGRYHGDMTVWNTSGYWQDQWRLYKAGKPSIYKSDNMLPPEYVGANVFGRPATIWFYDEDGQKKGYKAAR